MMRRLGPGLDISEENMGEKPPIDIADVTCMPVAYQ